MAPSDGGGGEDSSAFVAKVYKYKMSEIKLRFAGAPARLSREDSSPPGCAHMRHSVLDTAFDPLSSLPLRTPVLLVVVERRRFSIDELGVRQATASERTSMRTAAEAFMQTSI